MSKLPKEVLESLDWASAAHHEGGHATACLALDQPLEYAFIRVYPKGDDWTVGGYTDVDDTPPGDVDALAVIALAVIALAGPVSEALYRHRIHGERWKTALQITRGGNSSDEEALAGYLRRGTLKEREAVKLAEDLGKRHWRGTQRIAGELMRKQELSGRRIAQLIG